MPACLLPQYDEVLPALPDPKNRPPRLLGSTANPALNVSNNIGANCAPTKVEIAVADDDVLDLIRIRWVVYDNNGNVNQTVDASPLSPSTPATAVRQTPISAPRNVFTNPPLGNTGTARRLQLIIADGEFTTGPGGALTTLPKNLQPIELPDGGTINNETYIDTYSWVVDTVNMQCPP